MLLILKKIVLSTFVGLYLAAGLIIPLLIIEPIILEKEANAKSNNAISLNISGFYTNEDDDNVVILEFLKNIYYEYQKQSTIKKAKDSIKSYNSPMSPYLEIVYDRAIECGGDFHTLLAIAGNESGFGRIPYKQYNPFGYLNGVTYSGWEESLYVLSCKISQEFIKPCNNDLYCIIDKYGGSETDTELWINRVKLFIKNLKGS
jgi:hypothetical protein